MKTTTWLWFYKTLGRLSDLPQEVLFSVDIPQPRRLLFLFPVDQPRLLESLPVLQELERYPNGGAFKLAIPIIFQELIPASRHGIFFFPLMKAKPPKVDVAVLRARYRDESFDAVVNLDPELSRHMARVIRTIDAPKRIGFSGPGADDIYNIQIDPEEPDLLAGSYDQILALCDLGTPREMAAVEG